MLAAVSAAQQAAEQKSRRLEIKFARSDKGHALMRSAKFQASVADLEAQVTQLQQDAQHKASSASKFTACHTQRKHTCAVSTSTEICAVQQPGRSHAWCLAHCVLHHV